MIKSQGTGGTSGPSPIAGSTQYTSAFFLGQCGISYQSAGLVVPLALSLVPAKSVIDVGCGVGTWSAKFLECGVPELLAIDGDYVSRELLQIPVENFKPVDLTLPIDVGRRFDLAVCMEVAEHLPEQRAASFVRDLTALAPVVLFSAAIPGQGGTHHVNEQYLSYWVNLFSAHDYVMLDVIRPRIWHEQTCDWVYRQNAVLFVDRQHPLADSLRTASAIDYVHPLIYEKLRADLDRPTVGYLVKALPGSIIRSARARLGRLFGLAK